MKADVSQYRKLGRPATRKDKHGSSMPVRADRDPIVKLFFEYVPRPHFDGAMQCSGDKRFYRLYDALHDDAYPEHLARDTMPEIRDIVV